jgi:uncharacterized protein YndB with AHSA1/START domain
MSIQTTGSVQISRPAADVFRWLIEPEKLKAWAGSAGLMPADPGVLRSGFEISGPLPVLSGDATLRIENWDPPRGFAVVMSYAGGDATTTYTLVESAGTTTLTSSSDTDWGKPDLTEVEKQIAQQSPEVQAAMHHAIDLMNQQVGQGGFDATAQQGMQSALDASLAKLKELAETAYQFDRPFVLDSSASEARLGLAPTPLEVGLKETVAWWRESAA